MPNPYCLSDAALELLLQDDAPFGDATTFALEIGARPGRIVFRARHDMRVCGSEEALRMGMLRGLTACAPVVASGDALHAGEVILALEGEAGALHVVWKTAQTLMEYLSGIASETADIIEAARRGNPGIGVACTRKNFPGTKAAAMKAVQCVGAVPHRLGLSETLLVFAEHRAFLHESPRDTVDRLHGAWPERAVVVEVEDSDEAILWFEAGADVLQLEKRSPEQVAAIRQRIPVGARVKIAAAGGVNAGNAEAYARAGADFLVTSAPYFVKPKDVAVTLQAIGV